MIENSPVKTENRSTSLVARPAVRNRSPPTSDEMLPHSAAGVTKRVAIS
jgi:hypothetical protein